MYKTIVFQTLISILQKLQLLFLPQQYRWRVVTNNAVELVYRFTQQSKTMGIEYRIL